MSGVVIYAAGLQILADVEDSLFPAGVSIKAAVRARPAKRALRRCIAAAGA